MMSQKRGLLVIISSPSGAGKTTLARRLLAEFESMEFSVSYTTRPRRGNERDGVDYHFVDEATFAKMIEAHEFAEWALVHGNRYGTAMSVVESALASGRDVVFDVDWQGGQKLVAQWPEDALTIFILPPDLAILEDRLRRRATDSDDVIQRRLHMAIVEMAHHKEYEYGLVNDDLEAAYESLRAIYLVRRDGAEAHPELVDVVQATLDSGSSEHAEALILSARENR